MTDAIGSTETGMNGIRVVQDGDAPKEGVTTVLASPAIPRATEELWPRLGETGSVFDQRLPGAAAWGGLRVGAKVEKGDALFPRFDDNRAAASA